MKKYLPIIGLLLSLKATAQIDSSYFNGLKTKVATTDINIKKLDSAFIQFLTSDTSGRLSPYVYNKYIDTKFTYLSYQRSSFGTGNSASLDLADNATNIALNIAKAIKNINGKTVAIATAGVKSKISDGIANIFNGNTATSGTTLFLNGAFLINQKSFKTVTDAMITGSDGITRRVPTPFGSLVNKLVTYKKEFEHNTVDKYSRNYNSLICRLETIEARLNDSAFKDTCALWTNLWQEKEKILGQLKDAGLIDKQPTAIANEIGNKYLDGYYKTIADEPSWEWFKLSWFNFGISYSRNSYTTYNSALTLNKRFGTKDFDALGVKFTYNWFGEKEQQGGFVRAWYANISYEPTLTNNYSLIKDQIIIKNVLATSLNDTSFTFQTNKTAKDITTIPYKTSWQHNFNSVYTAMFTNKKNVGINLLMQAQISSLSKPVYNARIGLLASLRNNNFDPTDSKSKAKVNFEIFIQFPDILDVGGSGKSVWQNRVIGLSTTIPFNKIFLQ